MREVSIRNKELSRIISYHMIQNIKTGNCVASFSAAVGVGFSTNAPVPPRLGRIPKGVVWMYEFIVLVIKIGCNDENVIKVAIVLLIHEFFERAKVFLRISHGTVLNK